MTSVKINDILYSAAISGKLEDMEYDRRATKTIRLTMDYSIAVELWHNGVEWSIISEEIINDYVYNENGIVTFDQETGEPVMAKQKIITEEYDNSDYSILCSITDYFDGTIAVTMGKLTPLEEAYEMLLGGI